MTKTVIRAAQEKDIPDMIALLHGLFSLEQDFAPDAGKQESGLALMLSDPRERRVLVAESAEGMVVGMCSAQVLVSTAEGGRVGLVEDVVVRPALRGQGIGSRLMRALEEWAADLGLLRLQLLADRENGGAFAFYSKCGWTNTALICLRKTAF